MSIREQISRNTYSRSNQNLASSPAARSARSGSGQKKQTDDPIFKAYRKEYKKRFAWIKAGRITDEQFYAWSRQAQEEKKKCDREIISLEEFQRWLRES